MTMRLDAARDACERGAWGEALGQLHADADLDTDPAALELLATASYGAGEFEAAVEAWERVHELERAGGDAIAAARAAAMVAMFLMMDTGLMSPVRGWLRTAEELLTDHDRTPAHALIAMTRTYERFMCGDMDAAREQSALAIELGVATGVLPAVVIGKVASARVRIFSGDVDAGLEQLDEVGALLMSGEVDSLTTGMMYCELICAAQGLGLYEMACEWTQVMEHWRGGAAFGGINGRCRVHRAEMLRVSGTCDEAEAEALGACDELRPWMRREFGWPLVELGNVRYRRGDLDGAEAAFREAHEHAWSPQPGLALVRLAQGDVAGAMAMITDAIEHPFDIPSKERPPFGDLRLAPLLDAQAEIASAAGDEATVRAAAARLRSIADAFPGPFLEASARLAAARAALMTDDHAAAIEHAIAALWSWAGAGAPFEAACARLVVAEAYERSGRIESARFERDAAAAAFASFGAARHARLATTPGESAASLTTPDPTTSDPTTSDPTTSDPTKVGFTSDGRLRTIEFGGRTTTHRDLKGLRLIARLVAEPGREFHVLDLVAAEDGVLRPDAAHHPADDADAVTHRGDAGLPVLDDTARAAYRRRLAEIDDDIDDARRMNDPERAALAERDREYLVAELKRAVGLGGRHRTVGSSAERARTSVARSIRYALDQLEHDRPDLTRRLRRNLRTGTYCAYEDDPAAPLRWLV